MSDLSLWRDDPDIQKALAGLGDVPATISAASVPVSTTLPAGLLAACPGLLGARTPAEIAERLREYAQAWEAIAHLGGYLDAPIAADGAITLHIGRPWPD